jgi:uncharacterized membrane protein
MEEDFLPERKKGRAEESRGIDRLNGFSDAVFAVAITLLILTIEVPAVSDISQLPSELKTLWPKFQGFLISFIIIGAFWVSHHTVFGLLRKHKPGLLWINLIFLMCIVLLPFSTDLMSEYADSVCAVVFYDLNMIAASASLCLLWWYASYRHNLVQEDLDPASRRHLLLVFANMSIIFAISLGMAFISPSNSQYLYLLLIPNSFILERKHRRERDMAL